MSIFDAMQSIKTAPIPKPQTGHVDLYNQYRPQSFEEVIGQDPVVRALQAKLEKEEIPRFLILSSDKTPGIGKNTLARILAKEMLGIDGDPMQDPYRQYEEHSCANNGSAGEIREIIEKVSEQPPLQVPGKAEIKILMLDELHKASPTAISALLQVTENPPPWLYIFAATTDLAKIKKSKDSGPLVSRAEVYELQKLSPVSITRLLSKIHKLKKLTLSEKVLHTISTQVNGSAREALTLLSKVMNSEEADALKLLGKIDEENSFQLQQLINSLLYGWYIPLGGTYTEKVSINTKGELYGLLLRFIQDNPGKETARLQMIGYLNSMLGIGERGTPSPGISKELDKGNFGTNFLRAFALLEVLMSPEVSYYGPDGEGQARLLIALVNFMKGN